MCAGVAILIYADPITSAPEKQEKQDKQVEEDSTTSESNQGLIVAVRSLLGTEPTTVELLLLAPPS